MRLGEGGLGMGEWPATLEATKDGIPRRKGLGTRRGALEVRQITRLPVHLGDTELLCFGPIQGGGKGPWSAHATAFNA